MTDLALVEATVFDHEHLMFLAFSVIAMLATVAALAHLAVVLVLMRLGSKVERALGAIHDLEQSVRGMLGEAVEVDLDGRIVQDGAAEPDPLHVQADTFARSVRERVARSGRGR